MNTGTEREEGNWRRTGVSERVKERGWRGVRQTLIWSQTAGLGQAKASSAIQYINDNIHRRSTHSFTRTHKHKWSTKTCSAYPLSHSFSVALWLTSLIWIMHNICVCVCDVPSFLAGTWGTTSSQQWSILLSGAHTPKNTLPFCSALWWLAP